VIHVSETHDNNAVGHALLKASPQRRYPFLLVDRVVEMDFQKSATGYKNVTMNDNFFTGHFPERAIMPGDCRACWLHHVPVDAMVTPSG